ncbi:hypothetical protein ACJRO7_005005 [Eucalyptus globulus]|uniref:3,4-dihydroxy-2-butanone-4-phosphate synthase n=1 Tax=Eucalyptus globulus TaxID=34317 RepID=A0ABD3IYM0_EUCGL
MHSVPASFLPSRRRQVEVELAQTTACFAHPFVTIMSGFLFCCCSVPVLLAAHQSTRIGGYQRQGLSSACWAVRSDSGDLLGKSSLKGSENGSLLSALDGSASVPFGTVDAEITQETIDFFVSDAEGDPDSPSEGYSSIEQAINSLREGKDAKSGSSTGVSAFDRASTVLALSSPESKPEDFRKPGHVFPLKYRNGGVLRRAGHTEASVDLVMLTGLRPVSLLTAVMDGEDGSMASLPSLRKLALQYSLPVVSITDLIRYRRKREKLVERTAISRLPTKWGLFQAYCYRSKLDGTEHIAVVKVACEL